MVQRKMRTPVIFIFLDGVGLGEPSAENPLYVHGIPSLEHYLGVKLIAGASSENDRIFLRGIDAVLGVNGVPQSATGQTSLFTGVNAQKALGFHLPAFPNDQLIQIIESKSIFKQLTDAGVRATFANAYTDAYFRQEKVAYSVTTHCVRAAGLPYRMIRDLLENQAVYWDINRSSLAKRTGIDNKPIDPYAAGVHLTSIAKRYEFVLFECFEPDLVGHAADYDAACRFFEKLDRFLSGVLESKESDMSLVICSDHGNIEDCTRSGHTENPVPLIVIGPAAVSFSGVSGIDQVTPAIIKFLVTTQVL